MNPYQPPSPGQAPYFQTPVDHARIRRIASDQRMINLIVLAYFGSGLLSSVIRSVPGGQYVVAVIAVAVIAAGAVYAVRMASALHGTVVAVVCAILLLIPCVGLLVLLVLNSQATTELRKAGLRVGLLGVDPSQLRNL